MNLPLLKKPVWIWTVPAYFYVGGVTGAALVLGAAAQIQGDEDLGSLIRTCRWIGVAGHAVSSAFLIVDLGRPERFLNMLREFRPTSPLSVGSWVLALGGSAAGASVTLPKSAAAVAGLTAGVLGIPLAGYTGVLLVNSAIPVWHGARRSLPVLFVASAVASCASLFELMDLSAREERIIQRFGIAGKVAELVAMTAVEAELSGKEEVIRPLQSGFSGTLWTASKVLTAASLALTLLPGKSKTRRLAGTLGTLAGIGLRFAVMYAGVSSSRLCTKRPGGPWSLDV